MKRLWTKLRHWFGCWAFKTWEWDIRPDMGRGEWGFLECRCGVCRRHLIAPTFLEPLGAGLRVDGSRHA
jgi:hypothetical protein